MKHTVQVIDGAHPITADVGETFTLTDEVYLCEVFEDSVTPLLRSDYPFERAHFFSAHHAVTGKMFCNEDWPHPDGSNVIGWTKRHANSSIAYLQPGDGPETFASDAYRSLVENAIRWAALSNGPRQ